MSKSKLVYRLKSHIEETIFDVENYRLGRVLTVIDATVPDPEQRKAMKDVMREVFRSKEYFSSRIPEIIIQFCNKLGIEPFHTKEEEMRFTGDLSEDHPVGDWFGEVNEPPTPPLGDRATQ